MMIRATAKSVHYPVSGQRPEVIRASKRVRYLRGSFVSGYFLELKQTISEVLVDDNQLVKQRQPIAKLIKTSRLVFLLRIAGALRARSSLVPLLIGDGFAAKDRIEPIDGEPRWSVSRHREVVINPNPVH